MSIMQLLALSPVILSTSLACIFLVMAWREREERGGWALIVFLAGAGLWSLTDWLSMTAATQELSLFWTRWLYLGVCTVPGAWFIFALRYSGRVRPHHLWRIILLLIEPAFVQAAIWTNDSHHLFWTTTVYRTDTLFPTLQNTYGPLFWMHTVYSYGLVFSGMFIMLYMAYRRRGLHTGQTAFLMLAVLCPLMGNMAYLFGIKLFGFVDLTAPTFSVAAVFLFIAMSKFKLLRAVPVTRDDVFKSLDMGILVIGEDDRLIDCNQSASRLLAAEDGRSEGKPLLHVLPEWDLLKKSLHEARGPVKFAMTVDREERIFEVACLSAGQDDSSDNRILLFHDITQNEIYQKAVAESQKRFEMLFEFAPSPFYIFDLQGTFLDGNRAAEALSGYAREELIGKTLNEIPLLDESQLSLAKEVLHQLKHSGESKPFITRLTDRKGESIPVEVNFYPIELAGKPVVLGVANDVRERVEIQSALEREVENRTGALEYANRELQVQAYELERTIKGLKRFAYVASHDLQEPLRMVSCYTQLLQDSYGGKLDTTADEYIGYAVEGAKRMQSLIRDLIKFTHLIEPHGGMIPVDCQDVVERSKRELVAVIEKTGAVIAVSELPSVLAYDGQLDQLFYHLLDNALKFQQGEVPPEISIKAQRDGAMWRFSVEDNGIGIEAHFFERIFEIFRRLHGQQIYPGTGLGLALCRQIVENHRGRIWVESEPGVGSVFSFTWPMEESA